MVTVPVRVALVVFDDARMVTVPFPVPELPAVTSIHVTELAALQMQLEPAVTDTVNDSPLAAAALAVGEIVKVHPPAAGWRMVNGCPAMVSAAVRSVLVVFAATVSTTLPLPVPLLPLATVTQEAVFDAVQSHVAPAVTLTVVLSPALAAVRFDGVIA